MGLQLFTRSKVQLEPMCSFLIEGPPAGGAEPNVSMHTLFHAKVPHRFATFHAKRSATRTYVSSFLIVEPPAGERNPLCTHILFHAKRVSHMFSRSSLSVFKIITSVVKVLVGGHCLLKRYK